MSSTYEGPKLRKLLEACADLQEIRSKMKDPELDRDARTRLRRRSKNKAEHLARDLKGYEFRGPFVDVMKSFPLAPDHFQILAVLLQQQLRCEDPALEGRLILSSVFSSTYEVLARADLLHRDGPLRSSGLVVLEEDEEDPEDNLEARFQLSPEGLLLFQGEITGDRSRRTASEPEVVDGYANYREFLVELRAIHNLYRRRSEQVFHQDRWNSLRESTHEPGHSISLRIETAWKRLRTRLERTENGAAYPAARLLREYGLSEAELIMVIHLLFKELFEGNAYADVAELCKLVSGSEVELLLNSRLAGEQGPLIKSEILAIEPMLEGRALTGEAYLSNWAVNYLFGAVAPNEDIRPDERLDWHLYLAQLKDTKGFYRDLDAN